GEDEGERFHGLVSCRRWRVHPRWSKPGWDFAGSAKPRRPPGIPFGWSGFASSELSLVGEIPYFGGWEGKERPEKGLYTTLRTSLISRLFISNLMQAVSKAQSIKEFARHEKDTGSPDVQVALLTRRINHL